MVDAVHLAACLLSLFAISCNAAARYPLAADSSLVYALGGGLLSSSQTLPQQTDDSASSLRSVSPNPPGPLRKNGENSVPQGLRGAPIAMVVPAARENLQRPNHASASHIFWVRTTATSLQMRHVLLLI